MMSQMIQQEPNVLVRLLTAEMGVTFTRQTYASGHDSEEYTWYS